jgi:hypothetical protein
MSFGGPYFFTLSLEAETFIGAALFRPFARDGLHHKTMPQLTL